MQNGDGQNGLGLLFSGKGLTDGRESWRRCRREGTRSNSKPRLSISGFAETYAIILFAACMTILRYVDLIGPEIDHCQIIEMTITQLYNELDRLEAHLYRVKSSDRSMFEDAA